MIWYFLSAFALSLVLSMGIRSLMLRNGIVDRAHAGGRKIHTTPTPYGGGLAIFFTVFLIVWFGVFVLNDFGVEVSVSHILAMTIGGAILMIGGFLDDKYTLRARQQIWFPILAALTIIFFGIGPHVVTDPFSQGVLRLDIIQIPLAALGNIVLFADFLVFAWLMGMMFTTKFLDGLDGLVAGVVMIGALILFFLSLQPQWLQHEVALLSLVFAGACLGFLVWNWHPAKMFLGEGGSLFTGFMLGSIAILAGGKIVTTLLVVGVPMLDVGRVLLRRMYMKKPLYQGDKEHLHFKLLESGLSHRQTALLFYAISFLFGMTVFFLQSREQLIALSFLFVLMILVGIWYSKPRK